MFKWVALGASAVVLSGCAMPVPFQIASWALDGISVLATQKSVTDHGISLVAQQDCAVWRGVTEGELCREEASSDVMVAEEAVKTPASVSSLQSPVKTEPRLSRSLGEQKRDLSLRAPVVQVRSVPTHALRAAWAETDKPARQEALDKPTASAHAFRASPSPAPAPAPRAMPVAKVETVKQAVVQKPVVTAIHTKPVVLAQKPRVREIEGTPSQGIYFVIGSFRNPDNARRLTARNVRLKPAVLSARLDGTNVYRVVVGPVPRGKEKRLHRALARDGFPDTWAIRVDPSDWQFANIPGLKKPAGAEVATLQK